MYEVEINAFGYQFKYTADDQADAFLAFNALGERLGGVGVGELNKAFRGIARCENGEQGTVIIEDITIRKVREGKQNV